MVMISQPRADYNKAAANRSSRDARTPQRDAAGEPAATP